MTKHAIFMNALRHAAKLRGWHLEGMGGGYFALCPGVKRVSEEEESPGAILIWSSPEEIAFHCGATDKISLKQAAEADGLKWNCKYDGLIPADVYAENMKPHHVPHCRRPAAIAA